MKKYILTIALIIFKLTSFAGNYNSNYSEEKRSNFAIMAQMECATNTVVEDFQLRGKSTKTFNGKAFTGCSIKRYENGKIHVTGQYTNGKKSGTWITYWADGAIKETKIY